jgi:hypothetical protein
MALFTSGRRNMSLAEVLMEAMVGRAGMWFLLLIQSGRLCPLSEASGTFELRRAKPGEVTIGLEKAARMSRFSSRQVRSFATTRRMRF